MEKTPNHVCRVCYKEYWACQSCDQRKSWMAVACSIECYDKYISDVTTARTKPVETFITDEITTEEVFDTEVQTKTPVAKTKK